MTEERRALHDLAYRFAEEAGVPAVDRWRAQQRVDRSFWTAAGTHGLLCCGVPESDGGGGGSVLDDFVVLDAFVRAGVTPAPMQVHNVVVPHYIVRHGTAEQRRRWLPEMAAGRMIGALAMTEPDTGSDVQAIRTRAVRSGDHYVLTGAKTFITNGATADLVLVAATTDPAARGRGISLFAVETKDCAGFQVGRVLHKMGQHESDTAELVLDEVRVPVGHRLGAEGEGFAMLMGQLPQERLIVAVTATAAIEHAVDLATRYVNERYAFGKPLIAQQHVRFEIAECATHARVARAFLDDCIHRLEAGTLDDVTVSMAKWWFSELEGRVVDRCLQLFGGYGYMDEYPISRMYTAARAQRIYGGTNEIMKEIVGRSLVTSDTAGAVR
ncbi:acyl-CoA dehydrogenase family protein [Pseudonocardia sp. C8]|uniref:acyl-CoA dehydrogenase family protein n=1 Tax=Pseudonocardia sp. C8 TaxID=2762759 RepID=UPI001C92CD49|nr:acyl-CoA dehydrogenase family protein [Pseudonocardia sp. C8]